MSANKHIDPEGVAPPLGIYAHAVEVPAAATCLFVSGQVAVDEGGQVVGVDDISVQLERVFDNLGRVLAGAGFTWGDVVKMTTFLTSNADVDEYRNVRTPAYERVFGSGPYPASTLLVVERLAHPAFLLEIEAVAARNA